MPIPSSVYPAQFEPANWGGDACDQMRKLVETNTRLNILFGYIWNDDGTLTTAFVADLYKWVYGPLTTTGSAGNYIVVSTSPYASVYTTPFEGRWVTFKANSDSTDAGCTLKLDGFDPAPLVDALGQPIGLGAIKNGMVVVAVYDGSKFFAVSRLSQSNIYALPGRAYGNTSAPGGTAGQFPLILTVSVTKPAAAKWKNFDLYVNAMVASHDDPVYLTASVKFDTGSLAGSSVMSAGGSGNVDQKILVAPLNASGTPLWHASFDVASADETVNTISFKATITAAAYNGSGPDFANTTSDPTVQYMHAVGNYVLPLP